jgi:hypothetical protein
MFTIRGTSPSNKIPFSLLAIKRRLLFHANIQRLENFRLVKIVHNGSIYFDDQRVAPKILIAGRASAKLFVRQMLWNDMKLCNINVINESIFCQNELMWNHLVVMETRGYYEKISVYV